VFLIYPSLNLVYGTKLKEIESNKEQNNKTYDEIRNLSSQKRHPILYTKFV